MSIVDADSRVFSVRTHQGTKAFLDGNSVLCHKPEDKFGESDRRLYARVDGESLIFFVIENNLVKYIQAIGNSGRAMLTDEPCRQKFSRNVVRDSIAVNQNGQFWSAHARNNRFWLAPRNSAWENISLEPVQSIELDKADVILLVFDAARLDDTLARLNDERVAIAAILIAGKNSEELLELRTERNLPVDSFSKLNRFVLDGRDALWLMVGADQSLKRSMSERLQRQGIPRGAIVDFDHKTQITPTWLANVKAAAEGDYDFIATGDLRAALDLDVNQITARKGISLACEGQDLRQSFLVMRHVLEHNQSIKFALIGLTPELFGDADEKYFSERGADCRYAFVKRDETLEDRIFYSCFNSDVTFPEDATPDPNLTALKQSCDRIYLSDDIAPDEPPLPDLKDAALQQMEDCIRLCKEHGVTPIGVLLPSTVDARTSERIKFMRRFLRLLESSTELMFIDLSELPSVEEHLADRNRLNIKGAAAASNALNWQLHDRGLLPFDDMRRVTYDRLRSLRALFGKTAYDNMMDRIFAASIETIKKKDKIKIGFALFDSAMWCGDALYNRFARDERYEVTVFFCMRPDEKGSLVEANFLRGLKLLRERNLNVVDMSDFNNAIPKQDVLIYLTPYFGYLTRAFRLHRLTAETLITYIPYGLNVSLWAITNFKIHNVVWKIFTSTKELTERLINHVELRPSRVLFTGHPKMDILVDDERSELKFDWKEAQPNSVKIIWSPHWSIKGIGNILKLATFQWNYQFMYEYAAAPPETSWVVKPHPQLLTSAVKTGVFPSTEAFEEYLRKWNELPNAQVITGGYYQAIFATSDGIINDSGSFIAEYQYTGKPMLFLTRAATKLNRMGTAIIEAGYHVDGKDFDGIKNFIEDVLINKHDARYEERTRVFDEELNYRKDNGMLASEKIFRTIDQQLGG